MTAAHAELSNTLSIGSLKLSSPFVQAALSGYSDWAMRRLAREFGAAYSIAEVMLDRFVNEVGGTGRTHHYLRVDDDDHPVGAQLMGSEPATFAPAALRLVQAGFDVIDINFGCPVRTAMGGCRGGYHLSQPETALEIVSRVREAVPAAIPVTLKMRRGIDDSSLSRDRFFEILDGAFEQGVAAVTVHGRTVEQKYVGPSNWAFLQEVKTHAGSRTILGSGDLFTAQDCLRMLRQTGVDGVTIARGAIGNPWIFRQALQGWQGAPPSEPPTILEQKQVLLRHRELLQEAYGLQRWLGQMRKFCFKYSRLHPRHVELRNAWATVRDRSDWEQVLNEYFSEEGPGCPASGDESAVEGDCC